MSSSSISYQSSNYSSYNNTGYYMPTNLTSGRQEQSSWGSQTSPTMTIRPPPKTYGSSGVNMYYSGVRRFR